MKESIPDLINVSTKYCFRNFDKKPLWYKRLTTDNIKNEFQSKRQKLIDADSFYYDDGFLTADPSKLHKEITTVSHIVKKQKLPEKELYTRAIEYYNLGAYDKAEAVIANILKPVLNKTSSYTLLSSYTEQFISKVIDVLYHLGLIYLKSDKYNENYAKATAIFQYCNNFYRAYKPVCKTNSTDKEVDDTYFESVALSVEKSFLLSFDIGTIYIAPGEEGSALEGSYFIKNYKILLKEFRLGLGPEIEKIKEYSIHDLSARIHAVKNLYSKCSNFFINKDSTGFVQRIMKDCFTQLGSKLESDEYAIMGLGSFALGTMTPWSDLEFAILVSASSHKEYFRKFTKLLQIKIINLGETILPIVGVETLNNVRTAREEDEWFWDGLTQKGFCLDGKRYYACKTPLGRQGGYEVMQELDGHTIRVTIPDYELILTPEEMAEFQSEPLLGASWFKTDKHLVQALRSTSLIMGSQKLYDNYREILQHKIPTPIIQSRSLELLQEDVNKYCLKLTEIHEEQMLNVKETYRLIDRVIAGLRDYFEINLTSDITSWQTPEQIQLKDGISEKGKQHLEEALAITAELRLRTYYHHFAQKDWISIHSLTKSGLKNKESSLENSKIPHFEDITPILHHFYYIMLRLQYIIQNYSGKESIAILKTDPIFDDCCFNIGRVHMKFLEYDKAQIYLEIANTLEPKNLQILFDLFSLYTKMTNNVMARVVIEGILKNNTITKIGGKYYVMPTDLSTKTDKDFAPSPDTMLSHYIPEPICLSLNEEPTSKLNEMHELNLLGLEQNEHLYCLP